VPRFVALASAGGSRISLVCTVRPDRIGASGVDCYAKNGVISVVSGHLP
jgi:hypothetical protein